LPLDLEITLDGHYILCNGTVQQIMYMAKKVKPISVLFALKRVLINNVKEFVQKVVQSFKEDVYDSQVSLP